MKKKRKKEKKRVQFPGRIRNSDFWCRRTDWSGQSARSGRCPDLRKSDTQGSGGSPTPKRNAGQNASFRRGDSSLRHSESSSGAVTPASSDQFPSRWWSVVANLVVRWYLPRTSGRKFSTPQGAHPDRKGPRTSGKCELTTALFVLWIITTREYVTSRNVVSAIYTSGWYL